jgi:type IV pilus assembly protein PilV
MVAARHVAWARRRGGRPERGSLLLESLVSILIFSLGVLGIVGLQSQSVRAVDDAQYRSEAVALANAYVGRMWADDHTATDPTYFDKTYAAADGDGYRELLEMVERLPGAATKGNEPVVTVAAGPSTLSTSVSITLYWQRPGDSNRHSYSTTAVIGRNQ